MKTVTEQQIAALAPNPAALSNGRKISQKGGFVKLYASADDSFYMGECTGSGRSNYITSADFVNPDAPVFRCSCPSHQFPCKHSLALLFEMAAGKAFAPCEIPEDILKKREKKEAQAEKREEKKKNPPKINKAARTKKIKKQLEGLALTEKLVGELLGAGLGTMGANSVKTYRELSKQLGDYYLPGPQLYINRLILEIEAVQKDSNSAHYDAAVQILIQLGALVRKAKTYLTAKLENENVEDDDSELYEALGGVWTLERLSELGLKKENVRLIQLSFDVRYDGARAEFIDEGFWADADTGEIVTTLNYRPVKALKYIKQEDTVFGMAEIPLLTYYPGRMNRRVRWETARYDGLSDGLLGTVREKAESDLAQLVKTAKNELKNTLSDGRAAMLVPFSKIGRIGEEIVLAGRTGGTIALRNRPGTAETALRLEQLPSAKLLAEQVLFGAFWYDQKTKRLCLEPYSILAEDRVIRLLY